ncbi:Arylsulfatase [Pirellulimonas nuda]|uniref:Arylsulfatase n=1 Tax=Pirellulimonas nuda TaxID=2528009 RepID=A0A518DHH5_9BACT|nr:sulfatase [Pirellulimonas nuda]QDU90930.1 Arylsulfatase [Pirellulimonas nuda]
MPALRAAAADIARPNIVLILMDDMGWKDVGYAAGERAETPNIDRLRNSSMCFTRAYASAAICSASRVGLLTGQSPARARFEFVTKWPHDRVSTSWPLTPPPFPGNLPLETTTVAELLQGAGYRTAMVGKWHLNQHHVRYLGWSPTHGPAQQGFDEAIDEQGSHPYAGPPAAGAEYAAGEYPRDQLTEEAVGYLRRQRSGAEPFFLFLSHYYVHDPVRVSAAWMIGKHRKKLGPDASDAHVRYAAFVELADHYVGQVLDTLDACGLSDNTLVLLTSDNGGHPDFSTMAPLRGCKWNLYEGGIRVPMLVRWPGVTKPGGVCDAPVINYDLLPTLCEIADAETDDRTPLDGRSIVPLLRGESGESFHERPLYWHFPYYVPEQWADGLVRGIGVDTNSMRTVNPPHSAIRVGDTKLLYFYENQNTELYNLRDDPSEQSDLTPQQPERARAMKQTLMDHLHSVGARLARPSGADRDPPSR